MANPAWWAGPVIQNQISCSPDGDAARSRIAAILPQERFVGRSAIGRRICREFSFIEAAGPPQLAGCMEALSVLADADPDIALPEPKAATADYSPRHPGGHRSGPFDPAGLQVIGRNRTLTSSRGLRMHATLAVRGSGLPLGVTRLGYGDVEPTTGSSRQSKFTISSLGANLMKF